MHAPPGDSSDRVGRCSPRCMAQSSPLTVAISPFFTPGDGSDRVAYERPAHSPIMSQKIPHKTNVQLPNKIARRTPRSNFSLQTVQLLNDSGALPPGPAGDRSGGGSRETSRHREVSFPLCSQCPGQAETLEPPLKLACSMSQHVRMHREVLRYSPSSRAAGLDRRRTRDNSRQGRPRQGPPWLGRAGPSSARPANGGKLKETSRRFAIRRPRIPFQYLPVSVSTLAVQADF
jgi:hypothetical protein